MRKQLQKYLKASLFLFLCFSPTQQGFSSYSFTDKQVEDYTQKPSRDVEEIEHFIEGGFFDGCSEILDLGCGDGKLTFTIANSIPHATVIGCDVSDTMIDYATNNYPLQNLDFQVQNAEHLSFANQFDAIVSFNCMHWIKNQRRALDQIYQALKPRGKIYLLATPESDNNDFKTACRNVILSLRWFLNFVTFKSEHSFHTEQEYREMLQSVGFKNEKISTKQGELCFPTREELEPFLRAILTPLQHLNETNQ